MLMAFVWLIAVILIAGVVLWGLKQPGLAIDDSIRALLRVVVIVVLSIYVILWAVAFLAGAGPLHPYVRP